MPSPFYSTGPRYGLRALTGSSNISDIDAGFAALRDDAEAKLSFIPPRVTALPTVGPSGSGALLDGQECYFVADATNGVVWHLRYNAASASAYKWEFVGGPPMFAEVLTQESLSTLTTAWQNLATQGPFLTLPTLPTGGDFDVEAGALLAGSGGILALGVGNPGATPVTADRIVMGSIAGDFQASVSRVRRKTALASGGLLKVMYQWTSGTSPTAANRYISVRPVRVG